MRAPNFRHLLVLSLMALALTSWADVVVNRITIDVVLQADGSARMTEVWDVDVGKTEHTELFRTRHTKTLSTIENFSVSEQSKGFTVCENWVTNARDKEGKCGIKPTSWGYELCWGIGQLGHHRYQLDYTVTHAMSLYGTDHVLLDMVLFHADGLLPHSVSATVSRADSVLTKDDVVEFRTSEDNTEASFEHGRFTLNTQHPMVKDDFLGVHIEFLATAFGEIDRCAVSTDLAPDELTSPMMQDTHAGKYEESWLDKFWDFYDEWPLLTLFSILGGLIGLFYVIRKIAIALA